MLSEMSGNMPYQQVGDFVRQRQVAPAGTAINTAAMPTLDVGTGQ